VIALYTAGVLAATAALAGGIAELGRRLGGESLAARWVRGWTCGGCSGHAARGPAVAAVAGTWSC
jgi:hypothetical protein